MQPPRVPYLIQTATAGRLNVLVYGEQGVGKTVWASSAQDNQYMADVLLLNIEGGVKSVAYRNDIHAIDIPDLHSLIWVYDQFVAREEWTQRYRTVVLDSITELQTIHLESLAKGWSTGKVVLQLDDYRQSTNLLKRAIRMWKDLPIHFLCTALVKYNYPRGLGENVPPNSAVPFLTEKLCEAVMGYMDCVWYMYAKPDANGVTHRYLLTQGAGIYRAKTRGMRFAQALGPVATDMTASQVLDLYLHSETEGH